MIEWRKSSFSEVQTDCVEIAWRKSSFSGAQTDCVEVGWRKSSFSDVTDCVELAVLPDEVLVQDSKNPSAPHLAFPDGEWRAFVVSLN